MRHLLTIKKMPLPLTCVLLLLCLGVWSTLCQALPNPYWSVTDATSNSIYRKSFSLTFGHIVYDYLAGSPVEIPEAYADFPGVFHDISSLTEGKEIVSLERLNTLEYLQGWARLEEYLPASLAHVPIKARLYSTSLGIATPKEDERGGLPIPKAKDTLLYVLFMVILACVISRRFLVFARYVLWSLLSPVLAFFGFFSRLFKR